MTTTTHTGWQLDETAAAAYERDLVPRFFEPFAADLVGRLGLRPGHHLVDVACGTGVVARQAARHVGPRGRVTAVDISQAMLSVARAMAAREGAPIVFERADAVALPFDDASVDAVACQQGLQFLPDRPAALTEMGRILAPGGRLAVSTCGALDQQPGYRAIVDALTRSVGGAAARVIASPFALGDAGELWDLVAGAGMVEVTVTIESYGIRFDSPEGFLLAETSSSPLGAIVGRLDRDVREALIEDLRAALEPFTDDRGVSFPFRVLTATASRRHA